MLQDCLWSHSAYARAPIDLVFQYDADCDAYHAACGFESSVCMHRNQMWQREIMKQSRLGPQHRLIWWLTFPLQMWEADLHACLICSISWSLSLIFRANACRFNRIWPVTNIGESASVMSSLSNLAAFTVLHTHMFFLVLENTMIGDLMIAPTSDMKAQAPVKDSF